jgi:D-sedoheptulose 7-phosphate isomerase
MTTVTEPDIVRRTVRHAAAEHVAATNAVVSEFFRENADAVSRICHAMAERFQRGGRLFVSGDSAQRSDVAHVVVEFTHPVVVGKRALAAIGLPDIASGAASAALDTMARDDDMLMTICASAPDDAARALLGSARATGLLTIALAGGETVSAGLADHTFAVPSDDPRIVQETHEMLYHVLWELVHVFFEHRAVSA